MAVVGELVVGAGLLVKGLGLITQRPRLFLLGAIPPLITSVIFTGLLIALITELDPAVEWLTPFAEGWARGLATALRVLVGSALVGGAVLLMVISFTTLTLALGSPLYDKLSESVEQEFGDVPELDENVVRGIFRALRQAVALIGISALGALLLFATGFIPVVGQTVVPVISAMFGGWLIGIELVGSAFDRRGLLRLADRRAAMRRRDARGAWAWRVGLAAVVGAQQDSVADKTAAVAAGSAVEAASADWAATVAVVGSGRA